VKTLIINGSPRKNGDSMTLVNEIIKHLDGEVKIVNTYFDDIAPCNDCRYCWTNYGCSINDEMQEVYRLLNEVDNVILASPLYFSELTGKLLSFSSRLQIYYTVKKMQKKVDFRLNKKNAVLVITGGGNGGPAPAIERAKIIFGLVNAKLVGTVLSLKTDTLPAGKHIEAMKQAREFAQMLNLQSEKCLK